MNKQVADKFISFSTSRGKISGDPKPLIFARWKNDIGGYRDAFVDDIGQDDAAVVQEVAELVSS